MSAKYYAVAKGKQIGIYTDWDTTKGLVNGYPGAKYKSFIQKEEAINYIKNIVPDFIPSDNFYQDKTENKLEIKLENKINTNLSFNNIDKLIIYTDGSCVNYCGGIGFLYLLNGQIINQHSDKIIGETTNIRAELTAIKIGLMGITPEFLNKEIIIKTDSEYSVKVFRDWIDKWKRNGYKTTTGEPVKNLDLILDIDKLIQSKNIKFEWVKGHSTDKYNNIVDQLANQGRIK